MQTTDSSAVYPSPSQATVELTDGADATTVRRGALVPKAPKFSIIVPCYNVGALARDAVQSALAQTLGDQVEVIVVDDGSTVPVANELQSLLERIILVRKRNGGISSARNAAIPIASGAYISMLDGDDVLLPMHCEACLRIFESDPQCHAVSPDSWLFGDGQPEGMRLSDLYAMREPVDFASFVLGKRLVPGNSTFRAEVLRALPGPYDEAFSRAEDFLLHAHLLARGTRYRFLKEPTYRYRKRAGSLSFKTPIALNRAVLAALDQLDRAAPLDGPARRALVQARERYNTELRFNLFREAIVERRYRDALEHARSVRVRHLLPVRRRWKFLAGLAVVGVLGRVTFRG